MDYGLVGLVGLIGAECVAAVELANVNTLQLLCSDLKGIFLVAGQGHKAPKWHCDV